MLGPLADSGGPTKTHALLVGSPAIDKGKVFGLTTDQRGELRPKDNPNIAPASGGDNSDIGAFELQNTPPTILSDMVTVKAGSSAAPFTLATAYDPDQAASTLDITINGNPTTATVNGVTVSGLTINANGIVTANVATTCAATTGQWPIADSATVTAQSVQWGQPGDVPAPGDYDGDGKTDLAVWRGAESGWYIQRSSDGQTQTVQWGTSLAPYLDVPVPGDYDGDGKTDIAVFRQASSLGGHWYIRRSSDGKIVDKAWGLGTDVPVPGDYDGDGKTDIAVWRGSEGAWYIVHSSDGAVEPKLWGAAYAPYFDAPAVGDYDGDGKADPAVWRKSDGRWYVQQSSDGTTRVVTQGRAGDSVVTATPRQ